MQKDPSFEENQALKKILEGSSDVAGSQNSEEIFKQMVVDLGQAIGADYTLIGRLNPGGASIRTAVCCRGTEITENFDYALEGTPCEQVAEQEICLFERSVQDHFPNDLLLKEMSIEGYVGSPLVGSDGAIKGIVVALYETAISNSERAVQIMEMISGRLAKSLENYHSAWTLRSNLDFLGAYQGSVESRLNRRMEEMEAAKKAAEQANEEQASFLARLSHEIRTPVSGILGVSQLLQQTELTSTQSHYLSVMEDTSNSLLALLDVLVEFSMMQTGEIRLARDIVDLNQLLTDCVNTFLDNDSANVQFLHQIYADLPQFIVGDEQHLKQVLLSLLSTSFKLCRKGVIQIRVNQETDVIRKLRITIHYADPEPSPNNPFQQNTTDLIRSFAGDGIFLSVCKGVVDEMGGEISHGHDGQAYSYFDVTLPLTEVDQGLEPESDKVSLLTESPTSLSHLKVLVAEDIQLNQMVIAGLLSSLGITQADSVENGEQAVRRITQDKGEYDVILMDCEMPVMDGITASRRIREWEKENNMAPVPIYAVTAHVFPATVRDCMDAGMNGHLPKPLELDVLSSLLINIKPH